MATKVPLGKRQQQLLQILKDQRGQPYAPKTVHEKRLLDSLVRRSLVTVEEQYKITTWGKTQTSNGRAQS